jgi:hypothetical protein
MVPSHLKSRLEKMGLWESLVKVFDTILGAKNIWRLNQYRRSRFLKSACHTEPLVQRTELEDFLNSIRPVGTNIDLVRIGAPGDGGYLVPNLLHEIDFAFSPGVADTATFEAGLIDLGIPCFLADYSVEVSPIFGQNVDFEKKFVGRFDNEIYMTVDSWIKSKNVVSNNLLLQMDIEGAEWDVLESISRKNLLMFKVLVVEFHNLHMLFFKFSFERIRNVFETILKDYYVLHFHPNNNDGLQEFQGIHIPPTAEITFLRKDSCQVESSEGGFTHPLDSQNSNWKPPVFVESTFGFRTGSVDDA